MMQKMVIEVNLIDTSGEIDIDIGTLLVMQGSADWSEEGMSTSCCIPTARTVSICCVFIDDLKLQHWNPMESDFLNRRNNYKIDDEDAQLALHGYSMLLLSLHATH